MRITGTLHSIGHHQILTDGNPDDDETIEDRLERFTGILITADEATLRAASNLLYCTVDIYPHPVNELIKSECTPENYAHAMARLAHAEASSPTADHLAREVRSSQALIARVKELEQVEKARADRDIESMRKREEYANEREAAWRKYLDLRKQVRIAAAAERPEDEVHALIAEALDLGRKYNLDVDRMELADAKKAVATLEAQHAALLAKQAEQERLLSIYRTKYHEADRALREVTNTLARCVPPDFGVVPATNFSDETRENAWSQWWERNTRAVKDDDASAGD